MTTNINKGNNMAEEQYLKALTVAIGIITAGAGVIAAMLAWFLKNLNDDVKQTKKEMAEIVRNYLNKFNNVELKILNLEQKMINLFEDLRGVLNDHFTQRHAEVVEGIADLQAQITENVRKQNEASADFFKEYAGVLEWAHDQKEAHSRRRKKDV